MVSQLTFWAALWIIGEGILQIYLRTAIGRWVRNEAGHPMNPSYVRGQTRKRMHEILDQHSWEAHKRRNVEIGIRRGGWDPYDEVTFKNRAFEARFATHVSWGKSTMRVIGDKILEFLVPPEGAPSQAPKKNIFWGKLSSSSTK